MIFRLFFLKYSSNYTKISTWIFKKICKTMEFDHFCAAHKHSKLRLQRNIWIFMQFHKGEIQCLHSTLITRIIHHTRSDPLFKKQVSYQEGSPVPFHHPHHDSNQWHQHSGRQVYTTGIWQHVCTYWMKWDRGYVFMYILRWKVQTSPIFTPSSF